MRVHVKRVLVTGMSGTGKSTVIAELAAQGYKAVDADGEEYSEWAEWPADSAVPGSPVEEGRDWVWREDRMRNLLAAEDGDVLFVGGCAANMGTFLPRFDHVVLLSAPASVLVERLRSRTNNAYGKPPQEVAHVLESVEQIEPLLRRVAGYEIDTSAPLEEVVGALVRLVRPEGGGG